MADRDIDPQQTKEGPPSIDINTPNDSSSGSSSQSGLMRAWMYGAVAFELTGSVIGGGLAGWFIDRGLGTQPFFTVGLLLAGSVGGLTLFIRGLQRLEKEYSSDREDQ